MATSNNPILRAHNNQPADGQRGTAGTFDYLFLNTEQTTVNYKYDTMGRLLMRDQGSDDQVFYWLGLNRLAVEQWGAESGRDTAVFRPGDGEAGPDPEDDGWGISAGGDDSIAYVTDAARGKVTRIWNSSVGSTKAVGHIGDSASGGANANGDPWDEEDRFHMSFWQKSDYAGNTFYIYATAVDGSMNTQHIQYYLTTGTGAASRSTVYIHSPVDLRRDGTWQFIELDFAELLAEAEPTWTLDNIDGFRFYAKDVYVDDIVLSGGSMARSYQVVPGAALGGTLGVQTGADGGEGVGAWETAYYHYNDLGTVLATTDDSGDVIGAWVPDFNGNYTNPYLGGYKYTGSPDRPEIGLTGKWFDVAAGLYYFNARWLDPERARWMSKEPTGMDGPNLYHFGFGKIVNGYDLNGLNWEAARGLGPYGGAAGGWDRSPGKGSPKESGGASNWSEARGLGPYGGAAGGWDRNGNANGFQSIEDYFINNSGACPSVAAGAGFGPYGTAIPWNHSTYNGNDPFRDIKNQCADYCLQALMSHYGGMAIPAGFLGGVAAGIITGGSIAASGGGALIGAGITLLVQYHNCVAKCVKRGGSHSMGTLPEI